MLQIDDYNRRWWILAAVAMITHVFPPEQRGLAFGIQTATGGTFLLAENPGSLVKVLTSNSPLQGTLIRSRPLNDITLIRDVSSQRV